jgi:fimbrial chaperone protein
VWSAAKRPDGGLDITALNEGSALLAVDEPQGQGPVSVFPGGRRSWIFPPGDQETGSETAHIRAATHLGPVIESGVDVEVP